LAGVIPAAEGSIYPTKYGDQVNMLGAGRCGRESNVDRVLSNPKIKVHWNTEVAEVVGMIATLKG